MNLNSENIKNINSVAGLLKKAKSILFITGAGVSADSGLPTYRGVEGLYNDTTTEDGVPIEMALAGEMLEKHPEITWKYLLKIEQNCRKAKYNRAHEVLSEMEKHFERTWILTQNIDGFHHDARSENIIEIHGNMHKLYCPCCNWDATINDYSKLNFPPFCPECNGIVRPDVVFFGELLPVDKLQKLEEELHKGFDLYFSIGTTSVFPYIQQPVLLAKNSGKPTVEINPGETEISNIVDIKINAKASDALDAIWKKYLIEEQSK